MDAHYLPVIGIVRLRMATDGTGIRTLVGMQGCSLRCVHCLNPQSWDGSAKPRLYTPSQLYDAVRIDNLYFQATGGGITMGGGEPLLHMPAMEEFAALCPDSWNLWAETALNVERACVERATEVFQHFVVDVKTTDAAIYRAYTGRELNRAWDNLLYLRDRVGTDSITVRVPMIPGYADVESQRKSVEHIVALGFKDIDVFAYTTKIKKRGTSFERSKGTSNEDTKEIFQKGE